MESKRIVVVGGVAGGMSFATRYRRLNQNDHIIILEKGPYVSFANCGLPYHISGEIKSKDDLLVAKKDMLENRFQLDVRTEHEVISINESLKTLNVKTRHGIEKIGYDSLVLSVGANAITLDIEGMDKHPGIFTLRNIPDMDKVMDFINTRGPKSAIVIGGGFIGLEMAEALHNRGLKVSIVEKGNHVLGPLDYEMAKAANDTLVKNGIYTYTSSSVALIEESNAVLDNGLEIEAELIIMAVGVNPATDFLKESNVNLGMRGGIIVDEFYRTSVKDVYAIGDSIITYNPINNQPSLVSLASPANRQGRHLADILNGIPKPNQGSYATAIVRIFDMTFAMTGLSEKSLEKNSIHVMHLKANHHAGYFPGASPILLKIIFDRKTHEILGAQAYGKHGVDKRMDLIATAIRLKMKIFELQDVELSYAPPFGSAKDIINMAGYVGENLILGLTNMVQWHEVHLYQNSNDKLIVDVRTPEEFLEGHIEGAINFPLDTLRCSMINIPRDKDILVYCASGVRSYNAERILKDAEYKVKNLDGAYDLYASTQIKGEL